MPWCLKYEKVSHSIHVILWIIYALLEWGIGLSDNDTYIMRPIAVARPDANLMQIKDGFFWYNGVQTDWSFLESGVR